MFKDSISKVVFLKKPFTLKGSVSEQFLFDYEAMSKFVIDAEQYAFIRMLDGTRSLDQILREYDQHSREIIGRFIENLAEIDAIGFAEESEKRIFQELTKDPHLRSIHFEITKKCNMRCLHCYQEAYVEKAQDEDLSWRRIEILTNEMRTLNVEKIGISGGEPFMRKDLFDLMRLMQENEIALSSILTNGLLLDEKVVDKLSHFKGNFSVFVSLDGIRPDSMRLRGIDVSNYDKVFRKIVGNIKTAVDAGISVMINTAITSENIPDLSDMYDWFREMRVDGWRIALPKRAGAFIKNHQSFQAERKMVFESYLEVIQRHLETGGVDENFQLQVEHFFRMEVFENLELLSPSSFVCDYEGKKESCCIKPNGVVTPCPLYTELIMGNIKHQSLEEIWYSKNMQSVKDIRIQDVKECRDCSLSSLCATGCRANAIFLHGSIGALDEDACEATKFFLDKVMPVLNEKGISSPALDLVLKNSREEVRQ